MRGYIEFSYVDNKVFERIANLINYIKDKKNSDQLDCEDINIQEFYSKDELNYYWWPTEAEKNAFWKKYYSLKGEEKKAYLASVPWDFESVIDSISSGEYDIKGCEIVSKGIGRVYFEPWSFPYGGTKSLVQLIKPFDIEILNVEK